LHALQRQQQQQQQHQAGYMAHWQLHSAMLSDATVAAAWPNK
jgi:hypothetical protein